MSVEGPRPELSPGIFWPTITPFGSRTRLGRGIKKGKFRLAAKQKFVADPETAKNLEKVLEGPLGKKILRAAKRTKLGRVIIGAEVLRQILKKERDAEGPQEAILTEILIELDKVFADLKKIKARPGSFDLPPEKIAGKPLPKPRVPLTKPKPKPRKAKPKTPSKADPFPKPSRRRRPEPKRPRPKIKVLPLPPSEPPPLPKKPVKKPTGILSSRIS